MVDTELTAMSLISDEIVAEGVPFEEYMEKYAEHFCEYIGGVVVKLPQITGSHDELTRYLRFLLDAYFEFNPVGRNISAPFVMRVYDYDKKCEFAWEPDIQVILQDNFHKLKSTAMVGAADICIEVASPESNVRDRGQKFVEYEKAGVREYWFFDPMRKQVQFYQLNEKRLYKQFHPNDDGNYETPKLPKFVLHVPTLWQGELPKISTILRSVQMMFDE